MKDHDKRKADMFAGKGSVAGKLKEMRKKMESGRSMHPTVGGEPEMNDAMEVMRRGYMKEDDDE